jgi:hypothetical protein
MAQASEQGIAMELVTLARYAHCIAPGADLHLPFAKVNSCWTET